MNAHDSIRDSDAIGVRKDPLAPEGASDKFVSPGILLFLDQLFIAIGGWAFWLVISRFTTSEQIGNATSIYSLVMVISTITQLGFEYPLLRKSHDNRNSILGTTLLLELGIVALSIPLTVFLVTSIYHEAMEGFTWIAIALIVTGAIGFVGRYALLGMSDSRNVLIYDTVGTIVKFALGVLLIHNGMGAFGIIVSFLISSSVIAIGSIVAATKYFKFGVGDRPFTKTLTIESLANMPSKMSRMFILSLSIVLLASFGISSSETGVFYIAVMLTVVTAGFASSIAYMVIPASSEMNTDLSSGSLRLGITFTAPLIAILLVSPQLVLSIVGEEYVSAVPIMIILAIGILPSIVVSNIISKLNTTGKHRQLLTLGSIQLSAFVIAFFVLFPFLGVVAAATAMSLAFGASMFPALVWLERSSRKYVMNAVLSILAASFLGILVNTLSLHPLLGLVVAILVSMVMLFKLKNTSVAEIKELTKTMGGRS